MACPNVCPKFSSALPPSELVSHSSAATTSAFSLQDILIASDKFASRGESGASRFSRKLNIFASPKTAHFITSAIPAANSLCGRVDKKEVSAKTPHGWWNAPTKFFPSAILIPVLPPTDESTIARSVVGIW
ncbi:unknown [Coraliomargarita sp. CAG:312]|nr:unknown [Coraliomargarita sp. CAG:312]